MTGIFRAYDIRGIYPEELNEDTAYKIGRAFATFLKTKEVLVGRDARLSSLKVFEALAKGIQDQGADVIDIGLCSTPMFYYAAAKSNASIMVTASHNPKEYNGFKFCRENAIPISGETGIEDIENLVKNNNFEEVETGEIKKKDILNEFIDFNKQFVKAKKHFKIILDAANGMSGFTLPKIFNELSNIDLIELYTDLDFNFPNHEANPLNFETLKDIQKKIIEENADFGIATDGDGDRCMFIDEKGEIITSDLLTALIGISIQKEKPNSKILYDLRSSKIVKEAIEEKDGKTSMCRVGHSFIKAQMREEDAVFAGELSGHLYFKDHYFTESSFLAVAYILNLLDETNQPLSELIAPLKKYFHSGEINLDVKDKNSKLKEIEELNKNAKIVHLDGLSIYYDDFWFNVRPSNTEPLLRLNLEANSKELMESKKEEILNVIRG